MKKTDKKIENSLRGALTEVCDMALENNEGFMWLTHFVNYQRFPDSLTIVCIFDTNDRLSKANNEWFYVVIKNTLAAIDINFKDIRRHVSFDTEENCEQENNGNWGKRFN